MSNYFDYLFFLLVKRLAAEYLKVCFEMLIEAGAMHTQHCTNLYCISAVFFAGLFSRISWVCRHHEGRPVIRLVLHISVF